VGVYLGSYDFQANLAFQEATIVEVPDGTVTVPASVFEWEYAEFGVTQFDIGVVLDADDDVQVNNGGSTSDTGMYDRDTIVLLEAFPDLAITSVWHNTPNTELGLTGPLAVELEIENLGPGVADPWSANFYLSNLDYLVTRWRSGADSPGDGSGPRDSGFRRVLRLVLPAHPRGAERELPPVHHRLHATAQTAASRSSGRGQATRVRLLR
jgi:hypothetical protein